LRLRGLEQLDDPRKGGVNMNLVFVALLLTAPAQEKNEAEELYRKMEKQLTAAKTLQVSFEMDIPSDKGGKFKGILWLADGNKLRMDISGEMAGQKVKLEIVSDGTKLKASGSEMPKPMEQATQKKLKDNVVTVMTRAGLFAGLFFPIIITDPEEQPKELDADAMFGVSEFKLGPKEKIGQQEAQVLEYTLTLTEAGRKKLMSVSVWLDAKTNLPLQRVLLVQEYSGPRKLDHRLSY